MERRIEKYIPNTFGRYSITDKGVVFSNYRYNKNGKKVLHKKEIDIFLNGAESTSLSVNLQIGKHSSNNRPKSITINSLMEKCFNLYPPDRFHFYDLVFKDDNFLNTSLDNLEYRIRILDSSNYKYYPQPFYNSKKKIIDKICGECGVKKQIKYYHLQPPREKGLHKTYRNCCESCRARKQWDIIKSDSEKLKKSYLDKRKWAKTDFGQKYYKEYLKKWGIKERDNLTSRYLASSLRIKKADLTPQLETLLKKRITLIRTIKNKQHEKTN